MNHLNIYLNTYELSHFINHLHVFFYLRVINPKEWFSNKSRLKKQIYIVIKGVY